MSGATAVSGDQVGAVVAAAGRGERLGMGPKALVPLAGRPMLLWSLDVLRLCPLIGDVVVAVTPGWESAVREVLLGRTLDGAAVQVVTGGDTRQQSVARGLAVLPPHLEWVVVHDAARPLLTDEVLRAVIRAAKETGAAVAAVPVVDTLKQGTDTVWRTVPRIHMWQAQTPQAFRRRWLEEAHRQAHAGGYDATDDSGLVERLGFPVRLVPGGRYNLKVTEPADLEWAEMYLRREKPSPTESGTARDRGCESPTEGGVRVGFGFDVHPLVPERSLVLGGVEIPFTLGLRGHSDADVICHAVMDALLGSVGERDIGHWFPPDDPQYRDACSLDLLREVVARVRLMGYRPGNVDVTVVAEAPRLSPYVGAIKGKLAAALGVCEDRVGCKATSAEKLGALGRGEGVAAWAVVTVEAVGRYGRE